MTKKNIISVAILLIASMNSNAQSKSKSILRNWDYGFTNMISTGMYTPCLDIKQYFNLSKKKNTKLQLGFGVRFTHTSSGYCMPYYNIIADKAAANLDTFGLDKTRINSLNTLLALHYRIISKLNVEANIDLVGLAFGASQNAFLRKQDGSDSTFVTAIGSPASTNTISSKGNLNNEIFFSYKFNPHWKAKLGASYLWSEYNFANPTYKNTSGAVITNDRIRNTSIGFNFGMIYHF